jgi:hypothetical protein
MHGLFLNFFDVAGYGATTRRKKTACAIAKIEEQRDRMNEEIDRKVIKAIGIDLEEKIDADIKSILEDSEKFIKSEQQAKDIEIANWTKKCLAIALTNIQKPQ